MLPDTRSTSFLPFLWKKDYRHFRHNFQKKGRFAGVRLESYIWVGFSDIMRKAIFKKGAKSVQEKRVLPCNRKEHFRNPSHLGSQQRKQIQISGFEIPKDLLM